MPRRARRVARRECGHRRCPRLAIGINDAGAMTVLPAESGGLSATGSKTWSESSPGVPGLAVEGDHFNTVS